MAIKLIPVCDGCNKEAEEIDLTVDDLDEYQSDDLSSDLEDTFNDNDWGVYWSEEDEEHKVYCSTCKAYKVK